MIQAKRLNSVGDEPITLADCYQQLNLGPITSEGRDDDNLILTFASAAREHCENFTGLALTLADYEVVLTEFPETIELPSPPFVTLPNGITFTDDISDNALEVDSYTVDNYSDQFTVISPVSGWPAVPSGNRIRIRYRAGYGDESEAYGAVPAAIKTAMLLLVGHWDANREAVVLGDTPATLPLAVESLLRRYRVRLGMA